jgi:hypothetical protein
VVRTHSTSFWCWNKPRATLDSLDSSRPELGGSHHLPPYSIICVCPRRLHLNVTFSRDSQSGVPKLSRFGLSRLWANITFRPDVQSGQGLNQTCSPPQKISKAMSHSTCRRRIRVDSQLLMVGSQTTSLTPDPSFAHNLGYRCPNGSCEVILNIYTSWPFQRHKKHLNARCFDPCNRLLNVLESRRRRIPNSHFRECEWWPHTSLQVGLWQVGYSRLFIINYF